MKPNTSSLYLLNPKAEANDFHISLQQTELPIEFSPCRINFCLVCICLGGEANVEVDLRPSRLLRNDILVLFPGQILSCADKSPDFKVAYFSFSNLLIDDILFRFPTTFIGFLRDNIKYHLPLAEKEEMFNEYFVLLFSKYCDRNNVCRNDIILNLLQNFYMDLYNKVVALHHIQSRQPMRKKEIEEQFFHLVKTHTGNREVSFFAEKLCLTPKYLTVITKESTGSSAKYLIDKFAITELKLQLKSTSTPLKEIAAQLNYPSEAFLCKFFKKHTGVTPSHYRNAVR